MIKKLLDSFQPANYKLLLDVDSEALTFTGGVVIVGNSAEDTTTLDLHAKGLEISKASVDSIDAKDFSQHEYDVLRLTSPKTLNKGEHTIEISFSGKITEDMVGMYPSYFEHEGVKKKLIATQFESHHAREVFPCIDEPSAKATFELTLVSTAGNPVLGNSPVTSQQSNGDRLTTVFEPTPKMSTYLLAFVFGPMQSVEAKTKDGVLVRSWSSLAQPLTSLNHSLTEAVKMIEFYDDYFGIPYPLSKCDQVALPDFDAGAMENWGLITYRETAMLTDPENRSISSEQYVSLVIAHELSHQWFGNLVTMQWWDDLWLNESFASLMEYIAVDALHPEWHYWEEYTSGDAVAASNRDVFSDVQPVRVDVEDPAQISTLFDGAIVYAKGGRLLKMLREYIGEEAFRAGLKQYFIKYKYQNTSRDDLWRSLAQASNKNIGLIMNSWLEQSGLPIISVSQEGNKLQISQTRLLLDEIGKSSQLWQVPLLSESVLTPNVLSTKITNVASQDGEIVLLNQNASGHYVVSYSSDEQLKYLRDGLKSLSVSTDGRINSLNDMILLSKSGHNSLTDALEVVKSLKSEPRDSVWGMIAAILGNARMLVEGDEMAESLVKQLTFDLVNEKYLELGWDFADNEDSNITHLRRTILAMAVSSENDDVISTALSRYNSEDPISMNAELRSLLMSVAVRFGDDDVVDTLIELHKNATSPDVRADISGALASTKKPEVAHKLIKLIKDKDHVRPQDLLRWYVLMLRNTHSRTIAWQWLLENWQWVTETFASSKSYDAFPRHSASFFNTKVMLTEYKTFFEPKQDDLALERNIKIGVKEIAARIAWRTRDQAAVTLWLKQL